MVLIVLRQSGADRQPTCRYANSCSWKKIRPINEKRWAHKRDNPKQEFNVWHRFFCAKIIEEMKKVKAMSGITVFCHLRVLIDPWWATRSDPCVPENSIENYSIVIYQSSWLRCGLCVVLLSLRNVASQSSENGGDPHRRPLYPFHSSTFGQLHEPGQTMQYVNAIWKQRPFFAVYH